MFVSRFSFGLSLECFHDTKSVIHSSLSDRGTNGAVQNHAKVKFMSEFFRSEQISSVFVTPCMYENHSNTSEEYTEQRPNTISTNFKHRVHAKIRRVGPFCLKFIMIGYHGAYFFFHGRFRSTAHITGVDLFLHISIEFEPRKLFNNSLPSREIVRLLLFYFFFREVVKCPEIQASRSLTILLPHKQRAALPRHSCWVFLLQPRVFFSDRRLLPHMRFVCCLSSLT